MRKLASLLATSAMIASGLVAATTAPTSAGEPYPGSVPTDCDAQRLNNPRVGNPARARLRVQTGGNGATRGKAFFAYERQRNGVVVDEFRRRYDGPGWTKFRFDGLPRGRYIVRVFFNSRPGDSVYQNCRATYTQRVRRRG